MDDGLELRDAWITAAAHCVPPDNKPDSQELLNCRGFLARELELLTNVRVVVVLGKIAMDAYLGELKRLGTIHRLNAYKFGHRAIYADLRPTLLCSYHPSQQNTSTGRLTQGMLDDLVLEARNLVGQAL